MNIKQVIKKAYNAGTGDTYVEDILSEQAERYFNNEVKKAEMTEEEYNELQENVINAYRQGFYSAVSEENFINSVK